MAFMHCHRIGIRLVLRVTTTIILECYELCLWFRQSSQFLGLFRSIFAHAVFVEVVTEMHDDVHVLAISDLSIHMKKTVGVIGAGNHGERHGFY